MRIFVFLGIIGMAAAFNVMDYAYLLPGFKPPTDLNK